MCAECLAVIRASANFSLIRGIMRHGILLACSHPPAPAAISAARAAFTFPVLCCKRRGGRRWPRWQGRQRCGHAGPRSRSRPSGLAFQLSRAKDSSSYPLAMCTVPCWPSRAAACPPAPGAAHREQLPASHPKAASLLAAPPAPGDRCGAGGAGRRGGRTGSPGSPEHGFVCHGVTQARGGSWRGGGWGVPYPPAVPSSPPAVRAPPAPPPSRTLRPRLAQLPLHCLSPLPLGQAGMSQNVGPSEPERAAGGWQEGGPALGGNPRCGSGCSQEQPSSSVTARGLGAPLALG